MINNNIYNFFQTLTQLEKSVFLDLLQNLLYWINQVEKIKSDENLKQIDWLINDIKDFWLESIQGFTTYKKIDYTVNKDIANLCDIHSPQTISKLTMIRRKIVLKLCEFRIIEDLNISLDKLMPEQDLINSGFITNIENKKKFDFSQLNVSETWIIFKWNSILLEKETLHIFIYCKVLDELRKYYWEDELNRELNLDESYRQILFYKWNKKDLEDLYFKLSKDWDKDIIEKYEFINNKLYVNEKEFKIKDSEKTSYFLEILSLYFSWTDKKKISVTEYNEFYNKNSTKGLKYLILSENNIKASYIKTIRKQLGKKYINNEILKIEKWDIIQL